MNLKSVEGIIFLTYLTKYNIRLIYEAINYYTFDTVDKCMFQHFARTEPKKVYSLHVVEAMIKEALYETSVAIPKLKYLGINTILYTDNEYPQLLKQLKDSPPILYYKGTIKKTPFTAVVGTRNISEHAERITNTIVDLLLESGYGIVSGLALGIDTLAHSRTLKNNGYTIGILPVSLDTVYPKENYHLANEILEKEGALVSELIFGINRGKKSFVERNRLQTAFSDVVIPVELSSQSGTMHTVNYAKSQQKYLFLLKPSKETYYLPQYEGIHALISEQNARPKEKVFCITGIQNFQAKLNQIKDAPADNGKLSLF